MPYRQISFQNESFYHVFNRGVEKRKIYTLKKDYERFLETLKYYQYAGPKPRFSMKDRFNFTKIQHNKKIVEIVCFCLMPNHFHILLRQLEDGGVQEFIRKVSNSYTKYFNIKNDRVGHLLQGNFKSVPIETDEQLLHVSRYIHLNPYVAQLVNDLKHYQFSSYLEFVELSKDKICSSEHILSFFKDQGSYEQFVQDQQDYALEISKIKHLVIDGEDF